MATEANRLNPLSLKDWQYCFESTPKTRVWGVAMAISSIAIGVIVLSTFSGILDAIPDGAGKGLGGANFVVSLVTGALTVGFLLTNLYMPLTAAVFLMVRGRRAPGEDEAYERALDLWSSFPFKEQPVTAALDEALQPKEAASAYAVDCSLTLECSECAKEICPGCGDNCLVSFFFGKAYVWCKECVDGPRTSYVKDYLREFRNQAVEKPE